MTSTTAGASSSAFGPPHRTAASGRSAAPVSRLGNEHDNDDAQPVDDDRQSVRTYGHEATPTERLAVTSLVRRYFAAAAAHDGATACSLIEPPIARSAPESYGRLGPPYLRGAKTCAAVLSKLFQHERRELARKSHGVKVPSVRVEGDEAFALLNFHGMPERQIALERHSGPWRIEMLLDGAMRVAP